MGAIGILGGMGSYATLDIFKRLLDAFPAEKEWERPRIIIDNNCTLPSRVRAILYKEKENELVKEMSRSLRVLSEEGCNRIIIGCITAHAFLCKLRYAENVINMVDLTAKSVSNQQIKQLSVICSEGSRDANIWDKAFEPYGVEVHYPDVAQMTITRNFIEIVKCNKIKSTDYENFTKFVENFPDNNIILGCTELPVLAKIIHPNKNLFDPIQITIDSLSNAFKNSACQ